MEIYPNFSSSRYIAWYIDMMLKHAWNRTHTPQYSSSLKICGGAMIPLELGFPLSSMSCLSCSYVGSERSMSLKSMLCDVRTKSACCCCFFTSLLPDTDETNSLMVIFMRERDELLLNNTQTEPRLLLLYLKTKNKANINVRIFSLLVMLIGE